MNKKQTPKNKQPFTIPSAEEVQRELATAAMASVSKGSSATSTLPFLVIGTPALNRSFSPKDRAASPVSMTRSSLSMLGE